MKYKIAATLCRGCDYATPQEVGNHLYLIGCDAPVRLKVEEMNQEERILFDQATEVESIKFTQTSVIYHHASWGQPCKESAPTNICTIRTRSKGAIGSNLGVVLDSSKVASFLRSRMFPRK